MSLLTTALETGQAPQPEAIGRMLVASFRALNNLLEKIHQSFFFYLLASQNRYISILSYMIPLGLLLLPFFALVAKLLIRM